MTESQRNKPRRQGRDMDEAPRNFGLLCCRKCDTIFAGLAELRQHQNHQLCRLYPKRCCLCDEFFGHAQDHRIHLKDSHEWIYPWYERPPHNQTTLYPNGAKCRPHPKREPQEEINPEPKATEEPGPEQVAKVKTQLARKREDHQRPGSFLPDSYLESRWDHCGIKERLTDRCRV